MVSKITQTFPVRHSHEDQSYCSAATGTVPFCPLSSWHGCRLQNTVEIVSRTGTAVGCSSPSSPRAAKQQPQLSSTSSWRMQHGDAKRPGNTGHHSRIAVYLLDQSPGIHPSWLCSPSNNPQLSVPAGFKAHS